MPEIEGIEHAISSNEVFHLEKLPKRIVIAGGGYIANEFAGIFHQFGSHVTLVNRTDVDPARLRRADASTGCSRSRSRKGIDFRFNATFERIEKRDDGSLHADDDRLRRYRGRRSAVRDRAAAQCRGARAAKRRASSSARRARSRSTRTTAPSVPSIFAVGDVTDRVQLTPVAIREGQAFADTFFGNKPTRSITTASRSAVFSHPPLAGVGHDRGPGAQQARLGQDLHLATSGR